MLREETLKQKEARTYEEPDGEFFELISTGSNTITVLTRVESDKVGGVESPFDPTEYSVSNLKKQKLRGNDLTDEEVDALLEAEEEGKDRITAINAIKECK
jgi:hypothetical protein